jgi:hypothetical protein
VALDDVRLAVPGRTRVEEADARFEVSDASGASARLEHHRDGSLIGSARVTMSAHRSADPPPGAGSEAVTIEAHFESAHAPVQVLPARLEVMGRVSATVRTPSGVLSVAGVGSPRLHRGARGRTAHRRRDENDSHDLHANRRAAATQCNHRGHQHHRLHGRTHQRLDWVESLCVRSTLRDSMSRPTVGSDVVLRTAHHAWRFRSRNSLHDRRSRTACCSSL